MKKIILISGLTGTILFLLSIYAFLYAEDLFKPVAYGFLSVTVVFFIIVIITKSREEIKRKRETDRF